MPHNPQHEHNPPLRYRHTCPEGHGECKPGNMCRSCPSECATCQNLRYAHKGVCSSSDCFTCNHGYKHTIKHGDGRGTCEMADSQILVYGAAGLVALLLIAAAVYVVYYEAYRKRNLGKIFNRSKSKGALPT